METPGFRSAITFAEQRSIPERTASDESSAILFLSIGFSSLRGLKKLFHTSASCGLPWSYASLSFHLRMGAAFEEESNHFGLATLNCTMQRRISQLIPRLQIRSAIQ